MAKVNWKTELIQHDRWLRTVVFSRVGEAGAVDDVMQEVALAAVKQQAPLSDISKVAPWLYRLAVTQSLLYRRKAGRRRKLNHRYAEKVQPSEEDRKTVDPLKWMLAGERRTMVRHAMEQITKRDAEILMLKHTENWSYRQLAHRLGISESAVEARLHRARKRLRAELATLQITETSQ